MLSTSQVCLLVTTLPPLSVAVMTSLCVPWARFLAETIAAAAGPLRSFFVPSRRTLTLGVPSWSRACDVDLDLGGVHDLVQLGRGEGRRHGVDVDVKLL